MIFRSKSNISISRYENSRETNSIIVAWHSLKTQSHTSLPFSKHSLLTAHYTRPEVYFQSQQNAFSKHSLHTAGYFQSQQNAFYKHSLHPAGYFQSQQHAIHSPNIHYSVGVFSITTACHSFSKRFLSCRRQNNFALHKILLYFSKFSIKMKTNKQQQQKAKQKKTNLKNNNQKSENKIQKYTKPEKIICFLLLVCHFWTSIAGKNVCIVETIIIIKTIIKNSRNIIDLYEN